MYTVGPRSLCDIKSKQKALFLAQLLLSEVIVDLQYMNIRRVGQNRYIWFVWQGITEYDAYIQFEPTLYIWRVHGTFSTENNCAYRVGQNRIYAVYVHGIFRRKITKYTVVCGVYECMVYVCMYGMYVYVWLWPTLQTYDHVWFCIHRSGQP